MRFALPSVLVFLPVICPANGQELPHAHSHACAFGPFVKGTFAGQGRGDTFTLSGSDRRYFPADIVLGEIGGALDGDTIRSHGELTLHLGERQEVRYGRQSAHLFQKGRWLQGDLLRKGKALALPYTQSQPCRKALLDAESKNTARRGRHWRSRGVEIEATDLEGLAKKAGQFVMVTGIVRSVGDRKRRLYLNFGENWAHDFTVSIAKGGVGKFSGDLGRLIGLTGKKVQVRGVLEVNRGPLIRVIDDIQIKIIK